MRMVHHGREEFGEESFTTLLQRAVDLRTKVRVRRVRDEDNLILTILKIYQTSSDLDLKLNNLSCKVLRLPEKTDAFRIVNSDGDGLSGLVIDKYADVLSIEVHSVGILQRLKDWLPMLHQQLNTNR